MHLKLFKLLIGFTLSCISFFTLAGTAQTDQLDNLCLKLEHNATAQTYVQKYQQILDLSPNYLKTVPPMHRTDAWNSILRVLTFDTGDQLLYRWSQTRVIKDNEIWYRGGNRALDLDHYTTALNYCFGQFIIKNSPAVFLYMSGGADGDFLKNKSRQVINQIQSQTRTERYIDSDGTLHEPNSSFNSSALTSIRIFYLPGSGSMVYDSSAIRKNESYDPTLAIALILGGEKAISSVENELFQKMDNAINQMEHAVAATQPHTSEKQGTKANLPPSNSQNSGAELETGEILPETLEEALSFWQPKTGRNLIHQPPVTGPKQNQTILYGIEGKVIEINDQILPGKTRLVLSAQHPNSNTVTSIFYVDVTQNTVITRDYGINSLLTVIGKFKATHFEQHRSQEVKRYIARFEALFIEPL